MWSSTFQGMTWNRIVYTAEGKKSHFRGQRLSCPAIFPDQIATCSTLSAPWMSPYGAYTMVACVMTSK